jgi:transposase
MDKQQWQKFSPEVRARAVRMVIEHRGDHASQWAAIVSIAAKMRIPTKSPGHSEMMSPGVPT